MEAPLEDETFHEAPPETQKPDCELKAADEAIAFLAIIDSLVTVSQGGRDLGTFNVTVEFASRLQQPCMLLHAHSQGAIDDFPCGTTVTAYLSTELEVLEEDYCEYVKLEGHSVEKRCSMVQRDGRMVIEKVTTVGEEVRKESVSYPTPVLRGLVTEGSNFLLMRLIALRKQVPENMTFISFDQNLRLTHSTYSELCLKQLQVGGEMMEVFGLERVVQSVEGSATTWQYYFLPDGHLVSRVQVGSPVTMRLLHLPSQLEKDIEQTPLVWEEDMQMQSRFLDRKEELKADHASYLRQHPEIRALISDFLQFLLLKKPYDVFQCAREYFLPFASHHPSEPSLSESSF
ncbi:ciliogenesis-associated TTC17-interacting protein isoform X2 [Thalassophryne amazonica]|uniref:ciliogenesis-associated TTC17-interacting protein isoform X2 n=1 Tax=Thalassophryne amazonica TaxID=390379 RepID=UPI0014721FC1|nr:ciliogenesis-associated TTC17-interacting protein isoform X2 [Thalassophryne amazonica]